MKRIGIIIVLMLAVVVGFKSVPVFASSFSSTSENLTTVAKDRVVDGSAYLAGGTVTVAGTVNGDVYCAGQEVTITGVVNGDVLCAGRNVTINGTVKGNVRAAGMTVLIKGAVDGSVTLAGSMVTTDSASTIGRDVTLAGSTVNLSGKIGRDVTLAGDSVTLGGAIGRDVNGRVNTLSAASSTRIGGNVTYQSGSDAALPNGVVAGSIHRSPVPENQSAAVSVNALFVTAFVSVLAFIVLTVVLVLVLPRYVHRVSNATSVKQFATFFVVGLVSLIIAPLLMFLAVLTIIGIYAVILFAVALALAAIVAGPLVAYRCGRFMLADKRNPFMNAVIGAAVLGVLSLIPFIGLVVILVSIVTGVGMIVLDLKSEYDTVPLKTQTPIIPEKKIAKAGKK